MSNLFSSERRLTVKIEDYFKLQEENNMSLNERLANSTIKPGLNFFHNAIAVSLDFGNKWAKIDSTVLEKPLIYLNTLTRSNKDEFDAFRSGVGREEVFFVDGEYYKVDLIIDESQGYADQWDFSSANGKDRYEKPEWQAAFKIALFKAIQPKVGKGAESAKIYATYGLSTNDNKKATLKNYLKEVFSGKKLCVNNVEFSIELGFLPQGVASFFDNLYDFKEETGLEANKKFLAMTAPLEKNGTSRVLIVDGGWGTTDISLYLGNVPQSEKTKQLPGMEKHFQNILDAVSSKEEGEWLSGTDLSAVEHYIREGKEIKVNFESVNIEEEFQAEMKEFARRLIDELYTRVYSGMAYETVIFTGGFVEVCEEFLIEAIAEKHKQEGQRKIYKFAKEPQLTNCRGYLKFSQGQLKKRLEAKAE